MVFPVTRKAFRVVRKRGKAAIITSLTYKNELEKTIKKRKEKRNKGTEKSTVNNKSVNKTKKVSCGKRAHCSCVGINDEEEDATFISEFYLQK